MKCRALIVNGLRTGMKNYDSLTVKLLRQTSRPNVSKTKVKQQKYCEQYKHLNQMKATLDIFI